ncbi:hypothetical protein GCM10022261_23790 [Brevibacterium daeguense]|uniref:DUF8094 domain-containing protein n=1 Tax=Brevibacterium daeguense TaxID=909936 RepID=A0ABP8ELL1_9MICO|nr:hypothetical protein [Brevibacterium daeguense]
MIRLILGAVCAIAGLTVAGLAVSAIAAVGTDEVTGTEPFTVQDGAYAVVLNEQLVPYEGASAAITATGEQELFIGTASGVDTASYLTGIAHEEITEVDFGARALAHRFVPGEPQPAAPVTNRDWFLDTSAGTTVTHRFDLDAEPNVVLIAPVDPEGNLDGVTVSMSMDVQGVLAFSLLGAGLAVLFLGLAAFLLLRWWSSRLRPPPKGPADSAVRPGRLAGLRAAVADRLGRRRRVAATAGASALVLGLSGCAVLPVAQPAAPELTPYERPPLRAGEAGAFMTEYTERLGETLSGDQSALDQIQTGPLLERTRAEILIAEAEEETLGAVSFAEVTAGGPMFSDYPMWFIAVGDPGESDTVQAMLVTRESAVQDWKVGQALFVPRDQVPTLVADADGGVPMAPDEHQDVVQAVNEQLVPYLETGELPESDVAIAYPTDTFRSFREYVDQFSEGDDAFDDVTVSCEPYSDVDLAGLALQTQTGSVSFGETRCAITLKVPGDFALDMGTAVEAVMTSDGEGNVVQINTSLPHMLTTTDDSSSVVGSDWFLLSAQTSQE